jgi:hypothetical protein
MPNVVTSLSRVINAIQNIGEEARKIAMSDPISAIENGFRQHPTAASSGSNLVNQPALNNGTQENVAVTTSNDMESHQETVLEMECDTIRLQTKQSSNNNSPVPVGPSNAVDLIIASAARAAADAALADVGVESVTGLTHLNNEQSKQSPTYDSISPKIEVTTSRRKRTAAKSVLEDKPARAGVVDSYPLELSALEALIERRAKGLEELFQEKKIVPSRSFSPTRSSSKPKTNKQAKTTPKKAKKPPEKHSPPKKGVAKKEQSSAPKHPSSLTTKKPQSPSTKNSSKSAVVELRGSKEVFSGVPSDPGYTWKGWTKKTFERLSGKSKGSNDSYWYTPVNKHKLRSLTEVKRFNEFLAKYHDEGKAYAALKGKVS